MEGDKIDNILQNKGAINGNGNGNVNTNNNFMCQEDWFDVKGTLVEPADFHLFETLSNGSNNFVGNLHEQNDFFPEDNVNQRVGAAVHDSNFQAWTCEPSDF